MLSQLHFQHPYWLLALIPLALLLWQIKSRSSGAKSWANVIDKNLLPLLMQGEDRQTNKSLKWLIGLGWLLTVLALADPVWEKIPRPVFQTNSARVIVLDLSNSMLVNDLKPSRMARARFKVEDILSRQEEGQIGLVVFAGDAFTASPLTRDVDTIRSLLKVLKPGLMPTQGSRVDLGIQKAHELLKQANIMRGQVLLITDGASDINKAEAAAKALKQDGHTLSVLAVGTENGGKLQLRNNQIVNVPLDINSLEKIAKKGGGVLHTISSNDNDLKAVLKTVVNSNNAKKQKSDDLKSDDWKSTGPFLVFLLLPLAALAFRKGWLLSVLLSLTVVVSLSHTAPLMAAENEPATNTQAKASTAKPVTSGNHWKALFQNAEQRAANALLEKQYDKAASLSKDPLRKGSAEYKEGHYQQALESFKKSKGANARYNEGNALAKLQKYKEAIKAYQEALKEQPGMADALANKKALEDFLKKQEQKQKQKNQKNQTKKNKDKNQNKQNQNNKDKNNKDQKQSGKQGDKDKNQQNKDQKNKQQKGKKQQDQENKSGKQNKDGQQGKDNKKGKQDKNKKNQFSEANKALDKNSKKDKEAQEKPNEKKQASQQKGGKKSDKEKGKKKDEQSASKGNNKKEQQKNASKKENAAKQKEGNKPDNEKQLTKAAKAQAKAEELSKEEKMAAEQWLRRIPDDPGGLLRRKFRSQYRQRNRRFNNKNPW